MTQLFQNKYRIPPARLQTWNNANPGMYFITICTNDRVCYFGDIVPATNPNEQQCMQLSEIGKTAQSEWIKSVHIHQDMNLSMGEFVVMPNYFHAILIIGDNRYNNNRNRRDPMHRVST